MDDYKMGFGSPDSKKVEMYQPSEAEFPEHFNGSTTRYMERTAKTQKTAAADVRKQAHKGRYS